MLQDISRSFPTTDLDSQVCIAGAGPAGISLALELANRGVDVVLLEGGSDRTTPSSNLIYQGTCEPPLGSGYLYGSRLRYLGGTSNHWLGYCMPLDAIDFEAREWLPQSGWPFQRHELNDVYRRAAELCSVKASLDDDQPLSEGSCVARKALGIRATRFGVEHRRALEASPRVRLLLNASVTQIQCHEDGGRVDAVTVSGYDGRSFLVRARHVVLAMGGIENARMLLVSNGRHAEGIGNQHGNVGRFFMDHPVFPVAAVAVGGPKNVLDSTDGPHRGHVFRLSDREQRRRRVLNCALAFSEIPQVEDTPRQLLLRQPWQRLRRYLEGEGVHSSLWPVGSSDAGNRLGSLRFTRFTVRPEQPPLFDNRVDLGNDEDPFGNRRTHLRWSLSPSSRESVRITLEAMALEMGRLGLGRLYFDRQAFDDDTFSPGFHHMGTTRMHRDPRHGVVDADGRVHGVANLFVAGSSVFPTSGIANPTLTLLALTLRLGDHLAAELGHS